MVWLLPAGQGGFAVLRACLEDGHKYWLSFTSTALVTAASRGKGILGRTMQQWQVVGIRLRGGKTSMRENLTIYSKYVRVTVGDGSVVLSLRSGGAPKNKRRSTKKYIHTYIQ